MEASNHACCLNTISKGPFSRKVSHPTTFYSPNLNQFDDNKLVMYTNLRLFELKLKCKLGYLITSLPLGPCTWNSNTTTYKTTKEGKIERISKLMWHHVLSSVSMDMATFQVQISLVSKNETSISKTNQTIKYLPVIY